MRPADPQLPMLGCCPECGCAVAPDAGALAYAGCFYHVVCALWRRECRHARVAGYC